MHITMADDDWLQDFNKPKPKPVEAQPVVKILPPPPPLKEVVLREPPPSLVHTNSQTQYVIVSTDINLVLKLPEWAIERLNFLFLSKAYVVVIACDPAVRTTGISKVTGYGIMRAMGRREVEVSWLRVWDLSSEEIAAKNLMTSELQRNIRGQSLYEETSNLQGRNLCRFMDKLVFNSVEIEYLNERELIFTGKRARLSRRFQNEAEVKLVNGSYEDYLRLYDDVKQRRSAESSQTDTGQNTPLLPSLRALSH